MTAPPDSLDGTTDPSPGADRSLTAKIRAGLFWGSISIGLTRVGTTGIGIALARILDPRAFGVFAVALVVYSGILSMNELGVSLAIVRWERNVEGIAPTVSTISVVSSSVMYGICFLTAPWLASALGAPAATTVIRVLCIGVFTDGLLAVPCAMMQREFRQDRLAMVEQANFIVGAVLTVVLAATGFGPMSLALGRLAGNLVSIVAVVALSPYPIKFGWDRAQVRPLTRFGLPLALSSALVFAVLNTDYIIVGALLGPVSLGFYVLAFNLSSFPVGLLSATVRRVSFAGFSRLQEDPAVMSASFISALALLMALTVPVCALLAALSGPLINFVYGSKWGASAAILSFLAILGLCRVAFELAYDYLAAAGRSSACAIVQLVWLCALIPGLYVAARLDGTKGVGAGHLVVVTLVAVPTFAIAIHRAGVNLRAAARAIVRPIIGGAIAAGVAILVSDAVGGHVLGLVAGGCAGLVAYAPFSLNLIWTALRNSKAGPTAAGDVIAGSPA